VPVCNRRRAGVLDEAFEQPDDATGAPEQILGHRLVGEHARFGAQQPHLVFDAGQVCDPRGDVLWGVVTERPEFDQVEAPLGLGRGLVVRTGAPCRRPPATGAAAFAEQA